MKTILLFGSLCFFLTNTQAQYCTTGGPTSLNDSNLEQLQITGASGSINFTGCPAVLGVQYHTTETVTLSAGAAYVVTIKFGTCGGNFSGNGEAWIDYNGDNNFSPSESILTWTGTPPMSATGYVINVPAGAISGATRMRVMQAENSVLPMDPCATFTWGSVTDFNVIIQGGVDCSAYIGDTRFNPRPVASLPFAENYNSAFCYTNQNPAYNSPDVYYKIVPGNYQAIKVSLCGSTFDTFLSILDQNGNAIIGNDDSQNCGSASEIEFLTAGHDTLFAVVEGWGLASGDYTITISEGSLNTNELQLSPLGIYPNPTNGTVFFKDAAFGTLEIHDTNGKNVLAIELNGATSLDISSLEKGMYFVRLIDQTQIKEQKLIVQ